MAGKLCHFMNWY